MANGSDREVSLVIKAKNEASRAIEGVSDALRVLTNSTAQAAEGAAKADSLLGELGQSFETLQRQAKGLQALSVVARAFDKAGEAVARLESQTRAAGENAGSLGQRFADQAARVDQLKDAYRRQRDELVALFEQVRKPGAEGAQQTSAVNAAKERYRSIVLAIKEATRNQADLQAEVARANEAFGRSQATLAKTRSELAEIGDIARTTSAALGGVALAEDAIAAASKATADSLSRVRNALDRESQAGRPVQVAQGGAPAASATSAYRTQTQAVRDAEVAYNVAREAASKLGAQMAATVQPAEAMRAEFLVSRHAAAQAKQEYLNQAEALNRLRGVTQGSISTFLQTAAAMEADARVSVRDAESKQTLTGAWRAMVEAARGARSQLSQTNGAASEHGSVLKRLKDEVIGLAAAYGGMVAVVDQAKGAIETFREVENAKARLNVVFEGNGQAVGRELEFIYRTADRLGLSFKELAEEYTKVAIGAKEAGFSTEGTRKIFLAMAEAGRVAGFSTQDVQSAFLGLKETIEGGTINARNFNREIGQRVPGAIQAMEQAAHLGAGGLKELENSGKNLAATEDLLVRYSEILSQRMATGLAVATKSLNAEIGRFETNLSKVQLIVANGGFAAALQRTLGELNEFFKSDAGRRFFLDVGAGLGRLVNLVRVVGENFGVLLMIFKTFIAIRFATFVTGLIVQFGSLSAAVTALTARFSVLWTAALGPFGALLGAVTLVASLFADKLFTSVDSSTEALSKHAEMMANVAQAYDESGGKIDEFRKKLGGLTRTELLKQQDDLDKSINEKLNQLDSRLRGRWGVGGASASERNFIGPLVDQLRMGAISVDQFLAKLDDLKKTQPKLGTGLIADLQEVAKLAGADQVALGQVVDILVAKFAPAGKDAADAMSRVAGGAADANKAFSSGAIDGYLKTLRELKKELPEFAKAVAAAEHIDGFRESTKTQLTALQGRLTDPATKARVEQFVGQKQQAPNADEAARAILNAFDAAVAHARGTAILDDHMNGDRGAEMLGIGKRFLGLREDRPQDKATLEKLFASVGLGQLDPEKVAWCGAWMAFMTAKAGLPLPKNPLAAESWATFGTKVEPGQARPGDTAIIKRPGETRASHVGVVDSIAADGSVVLLGGNQSDSVKLSRFSAQSVSQFRRAPTSSEVAQSQEVGANTVAEFIRSLGDIARQAEAETAALGQSARDAFINSKIQPEIQKAENAKQNVQPADQKKIDNALADKLPALKAVFGAEFDAKKEQEDQKVLAALIDEVDGKYRTLTRDIYIQNEAKKRGIDLTTATGKAIAEQLGKQFDQQKQEQAYNDAIGLADQRKSLVGELQNTFKEGDADKVREVSREVAEITARLKAALPAAIAFAQSLGDEKKIAALQKLQANVDKLKTDLVTVQEINQQLASGGTSGIIKVTEAAGRFLAGFGKIKDILSAAGNAVRQFASDFLRYLAEIVIKYYLLQAIMKSPIGGWLGGVINATAGTATQKEAAAELTAAGGTLTASGSVLTGAATMWDATAAAIQAAADTLMAANSASAVGLFHSGGIAGSAGGMRRTVSPTIFAGALRYHTGGIAGLRPNEVATILKRGEEILTEDDPRHVVNRLRGGGPGFGGSAGANVKIVNAVDGSDALSHALSSEVGQKVILNHMRANRLAYGSALGIRTS